MTVVLRKRTSGKILKKIRFGVFLIRLNFYFTFGSNRIFVFETRPNQARLNFQNPSPNTVGSDRANTFRAARTSLICHRSNTWQL